MKLSDKNAKVNILITQFGRACLADFGLATAKDSKSLAVTSAPMTRTWGTLRWQAPELLDPDLDDAKCINTMASDVYAYALVCYEVSDVYPGDQHRFSLLSQIFSGQMPFHDIKKDYKVISAVMDGKRPRRPMHDIGHIRGLDDDIWSIIESCWNQEWAHRPIAHQIVLQLRSSPSWSADKRPVDKFDPSFPSRSLYTQTDHPFAALHSSSDSDT
jgi:serine/threonine protein kinase